ncbi:MAG: hypothetical protein KF754_16395 [Planctomycetes bacterium]|nr:hypothetical protein [Planctomycetota bacterium]
MNSEREKYYLRMTGMAGKQYERWLDAFMDYIGDNGTLRGLPQSMRDEFIRMLGQQCSGVSVGDPIPLTHQAILKRLREMAAEIGAQEGIEKAIQAANEAAGFRPQTENE